MAAVEIDAALEKLRTAVGAGRSMKYCLHLWSVFVRTRDNFRCVLCGSKSKLAAHHVTRKCFMPYARLSPGNGITLCRRCHAEPHAAFNGRPDLNLPMDAQGGEKIELLMGFYGALAIAVRRRKQVNPDWYYLSLHTLHEFKFRQGFPDTAEFDGLPVEQAYWIWRQPSHSVLRAIAEANGLHIPYGHVMRRGITVMDDPGGSGGLFVTLMDGLND